MRGPLRGVPKALGKGGGNLAIQTLSSLLLVLAASLPHETSSHKRDSAFALESQFPSRALGAGLGAEGQAV